MSICIKKLASRVTSELYTTLILLGGLAYGLPQVLPPGIDREQDRQPQNGESRAGYHSNLYPQPPAQMPVNKIANQQNHHGCHLYGGFMFGNLGY